MVVVVVVFFFFFPAQKAENLPHNIIFHSLRLKFCKFWPLKLQCFNTSHFGGGFQKMECLVLWARVNQHPQMYPSMDGWMDGWCMDRTIFFHWVIVPKVTSPQPRVHPTRRPQNRKIGVGGVVLVGARSLQATPMNIWLYQMSSRFFLSQR